MADVDAENRRGSAELRAEVAVKILKQAEIYNKAPLPCCCCWFIITTFLSVLGIGGLSIDIARDGRNPYAVYGWEGTDKHDAMLFAMDSVNLGKSTRQATRAPANSFMITYFALDGGTVFRKKYVEMMKQLEDELLKEPDWPKVCWKSPITGQCMHLSITQYLTGPDGKILDDDKIHGVLENLEFPPKPGFNGSLTAVMGAQFHMEENFRAPCFKSPMTRSLLPFGVPLDGYKDTSDRPFDQESEIGNVELRMAKVLDRVIPEHAKDGLETFYLGGQKVWQKHINERLTADSLFALGSLIFVWSYVFFHIRSVFLACVGMLQVVFAFPIAIFITQDIFGLKYFDLMNSLLIYLLLAIGADNLFVMLDAWKQSSNLTNVELGMQDPSDDMERVKRRMSYTLKRAFRAEFACTVTTAAAFFSNATSGIAPTAQFGIFAGTMIVTDFVLIMCFFPSCILVHHYYLRGSGCCPPYGCCNCECCNKGIKEKELEVVGAGDCEGQKEWSLEHYPFIEKLFYNKVGPFVISKKKPLLGCFLTFILVMVACAWQIKPARESPQWLPDDDPLQIMLFRLQCYGKADYCFSSNTNEEVNNNAIMVWGVDPVPNRDGFSKFDDFTEACDNGPCGTHSNDDSFDLAQPAVQQYVLDTCAQGAKLKHVNLGVAIHCVMADFKCFLEAQGLAFPAPAADFNSLFFNFTRSTVQCPNGDPEDMMIKYVESRNINFPQGGKVKHIVVSWQTPWKRRTFVSQDEMWAGYEEFMAFEKDIQGKAPPGGGKPFMTSQRGHGIFLLMKVIKEFEDSVIRGVCISLSVALVILLVVTGNWVVGAIAACSMGGITAITIGMMFVYGWELGIIEAICAVLVVGFSVDFTVHYGISYAEKVEGAHMYQLGDSREEKTKHAFFELGTSVLAGALTTIGASMFLFACQQTFFRTFGIFLCTAEVWSFIIANCFFMPAMATLGPENGKGKLPWHGHK